MTISPAESPAHSETDSLRNLFGMRRLALNQAFALAVGRDAYDEPQEVERLLEELVVVREAQLALLISAREARSLSKSLKTVSNDPLALPFLINDILSDMKSSETALPGGPMMNMEQERLYPNEGRLLCELAKSSGVARLLSDSEASDKIAHLCGRQLSEEQLAFGETLDNLERGYSISPSRGAEGNITFEVLGLPLSKAPAELGRLVSGTAPSSAHFYDAQADNKLGKKNLVDLLTRALSLKNKPQERTPRELINPSTAVFGPLPKWSKMNLATLAKSEEELSLLIDQAKNGNFISDILNSSNSTARKKDHLGFATDALSYSQLRDILDEPLEAISAKGEKIAAKDRQARAVAWFDEIAGHRSAELVRKVWGSHAARATSFAEIEMIACNAENIWKSLDGQEALGLFSVRMARSLGLSLTGRDLPERVKTKLKSSCGFTDGAWRLLGKLSADKDSPACRWAIHLGKRLEFEEAISSISDVRAVIERKTHTAHLRDLQHLLERGTGSGQTPDSKEETQKLFAVAMSTCSAKGAGVEKTEALLDKLLSDKSAFVTSFFTPSQPQGQDGDIPAADVAAEIEAFHAKAPILLARMFEKFLAKPDEKRWPLFTEIRDWIKDAEWGTWRDLPANGIWEEVNRRQKNWHDMIQRRERSEHETISWQSLAGPDSNPQTGFSSMPLTDGGMLWDEGKAMRHCVSSYADRCLNGGSRIFSIMKDGLRFGTLQLALNDQNEWQVVQFRGKCNQSIDDERAGEFTSRICEAYRKAHAALMQNPSGISISGKLAALRAEPAQREGARPPEA